MSYQKTNNMNIEKTNNMNIEWRRKTMSLKTYVTINNESSIHHNGVGYISGYVSDVNGEKGEFDTLIYAIVIIQKEILRFHLSDLTAHI